MEPQHVKWDDLAKEPMLDGIERRYIHGAEAMIAQIFLQKGALVPKHTHPNEQVTYIVSGTLRLRLGEDPVRVFDVRAGEVLVIPRDLPHSAEALEDTLDVDVFSPPRQDWIAGTDAYLRKK